MHPPFFMPSDRKKNPEKDEELFKKVLHLLSNLSRQTET